MSENMPPDPASESPDPAAGVDLGQVLQALHAIQSVQVAILEELQAQGLATLLPTLEATSVPEPTPDPEPTQQVPLLFQHLSQIGMGRAGQWVMRPLRWGIAKPVEWLILKPFHWTVYKPFNYLFLSPLIFGIKQIPYAVSPATKGLVGWMESLEEKEWERDLDRLASALEELGILKVLDAAGKLAIILGIITWVWGADDRAKQTYYQAWSMINSASSLDASTNSNSENPEEQPTSPTQADPGSSTSSSPASQNKQEIKLNAEGGRLQAMEDLYGNNQSLAGIQVPSAILNELDLGRKVTLGSVMQWESCWQSSFQGLLEVKSWDALSIWAKRTWRYRCSQNAILSSANLEAAQLRGANLQGAYVGFANLRTATLEEAELKDANLQGSNLEGAYLNRTDLERAWLYQANLEEAKLDDANLEEAVLDYSNLESASLTNANLERASLDGSRLAKADLTGAILNQVTLLGTQLEAAENLEAQQLETAYLCATKLPPALQLDPDRDCDRLVKYWVERGWSPTEKDARDSIEQIRKESTEAAESGS